MCPSVSPQQAEAIQEAGVHANRLYFSWHLELPISYTLNKSPSVMNHLEQNYRYPFIRLKVTSCEFRRRWIPGMGPSTSDEIVMEVSWNERKDTFYLHFKQSMNTSTDSSNVSESGRLSEAGSSNAIVARRPEGLPKKVLPEASSQATGPKKPDFSVEQRLNKVEGRLRLLEAWKLK